jgi:hypothetical protein
MEVQASPEALFVYADDHEQLASHMMRSSMMMAGSRMIVNLDDQEGRAPGSVIRMAGRMLGLPLSLEEVVTERTPPERKVWETAGTPQLYVIGGYRMGFFIVEAPRGARLTVFIDYDPPSGFLAWFRGMLGSVYAKWCVTNMAKGVASHFNE